MAPASDLAAMSNPDTLGRLLVRVLQLAPRGVSSGGGGGGGGGASATAREAAEYAAFVGHALELSARLMRGDDDDDAAGGAFQPWQLASIAYHLAGAGVAPGPRWERALLSSVRRQLDAGAWAEPRDLSKLAFALARLRVAAPPAWQASFLEAWGRAAQVADARQLSSLLWAVGTLGWRMSGEQLSQARALATALLPECADRDVVWLLWGLAAVHSRSSGGGGDGSSGSSKSKSSSGSSGGMPRPGPPGRGGAVRPDAPLELAVQRALTRALPSLGPRELTLAADALALAARQQQQSGLGDLGPADRRALLAGVVARAGEAMAAFRFADLASLLDALAKLRAAPLLPQPWADAAAAQLQAQLPLCQPEGVAAALSAVGSLGWRGQRAAVSRLLWRSEQLLGAMAPGDLARLASGLVRLGERPPPVWLANFMAAFEAEMPRAPPHALCTVAWALARLTVRPARGGTWTEALLAAAAARGTIERLAAPDLGRLLYALGVWRHHPSDARAWAALQARLRELLPRADARTVAVLAHALGRMRPHSDGRRGGGGGGGSNSSKNGDDAAAAAASAGGQPSVIEASTLDALVRRTGQLLAAAEAAAPPAPGSGGGPFGAADLANAGRGLALLGARPDDAWLAAWRCAVERADVAFDRRTRAAVQWASGALEGSTQVWSREGGGGEGGGSSGDDATGDDRAAV